MALVRRVGTPRVREPGPGSWTSLNAVQGAGYSAHLVATRVYRALALHQGRVAADAWLCAVQSKEMWIQLRSVVLIPSLAATMTWRSWGERVLRLN